MPSFEPFAAAGVRGFLHRPQSAAGQGLVLTHGAGGNCRAPLLVAAAAAFSTAGLAVLRCDLPFRQRRPSGPPSPSGAAADRAGLKEAALALRGIVAGPVSLGGQSYGGRQATMLVADEPELAAALMLFSYPLHPPGKPDRPRIEHFPRLRVPALFVQGTADPFGSIAEVSAAITAIPASTQVLPIDGAGHDLRRGRFDLTAIVTAFRALAPGPRRAASGEACGRSRRDRPTRSLDGRAFGAVVRLAAKTAVLLVSPSGFEPKTY
jgi:predicted alpha/beta-hydrolase family hydrolase